MKNVVPPLTLVQERALEYLEAKFAAKESAEYAKKRQEDMVKLAAREGVGTIKIHHNDKLYIFDLSNKIAVKATVLDDVRIEKVEKEEAEAAGAGGHR